MKGFYMCRRAGSNNLAVCCACNIVSIGCGGKEKKQNNFLGKVNQALKALKTGKLLPWIKQNLYKILVRRVL